MWNGNRNYIAQLKGNQRSTSCLDKTIDKGDQQTDCACGILSYAGQIRSHTPERKRKLPIHAYIRYAQDNCQT